jgi:hypothetical protein
MRLPRMTTRRWMAVVLAASLPLGAFAMWRRSVEFQRMSLAYQREEKSNRFFLDNSVAFIRLQDGRVAKVVGDQTLWMGDDRAWKVAGPQTFGVAPDGSLIKLTQTPEYDVDTLQRRADHNARLKEKYRRAATRPWLPVEPDPPEPK